MIALDSRVWLVWLVVASLVPILTRNPVLSGEVLLIVLIVHLSSAQILSSPPLGWLLKLVAGFAVVGAVFNMLAVHAGTSVLFTVPGRVPLIGGPITLNALIYGLCNALALLAIVSIAIQVGSRVEWMSVLATLPSRLSGLAVACSVAWMFLPQVAVSFRQVREARMMRGYPTRSVRDLLPLVLPLLAIALERAMTTAEAIEARGFGMLADQRRVAGFGGRRMAASCLVAGLLALLTAGFALGTGASLIAVLLFIAGVALVGGGYRIASPGSTGGPTRYRVLIMPRIDRLIVAVLVVLGAALVMWRIVFPDDFAYEPYPDLTVPPMPVGLIALIGLLILPAVVITFGPVSTADGTAG